jgi:hypothetical protein
VEVKRATDTRIRREVVGQMLDYAANSQRYWPIDRVRRMAEQTYGDVTRLDEAIGRLLDIPEGGEGTKTIATFWSTVADNLRQGRVRLVFVADAIPPELKRIIEFLNEQMPRVHVVGLELVQYRDGELAVLVPRVIGQTEAARDAKGASVGTPRAKTDQAAFLAACPPAIRDFYVELLGEADRRKLYVYWGAKGFSVNTPPGTHRRKVTLLYGFPPGAYGESDYVFQVFLRDFDETERQGLRGRLLDLGPVTEKGRFTLQMALRPDSLVQARRALAEAWRIEDGLRRPG